MSFRSLYAFGFVVLVMGAVPCVVAAPAEGEVRPWLVRIHEAAGHSNFQGTFVVSGGGSVSSARIAHYCDGRNQYERIESLDGPARQVFRHNDRVHTFWPASRVALIEQRDMLTAFPALLQAGDDLIHDFYSVQLQGAERIAGREADVLWVRPRDAHRYGYRLCSGFFGVNSENISIV